MKKLATIVIACLLSVFSIMGASAVMSPPPIKIVLDAPYTTVSAHPGWEERGAEFARWLSPSVRMRVFNGLVTNYGSGTMVYYDESKNDMYVLSCGHIFFDKGRGRNQQREIGIDVYYQNESKLSKIKSYKAEYLCHVWEGSFDVSLCKFKPDWANPGYLPIAPSSFKLKAAQKYHNVGCDGRQEVAHYLVKFLSEVTRGEVTELYCEDNIPRQGRSGGGLFTEDGLLVGVTSRAGMAVGLWSSVQQIHKFLTEEGYQFVLEGAEPARKIPIIDKNSSQKKYTRSFIPIPRLDNKSYKIILR